MLLRSERDVIWALAEAIARMEGFYKDARKGIPTVARRLNNPGNLRTWKDRDGRPYPTLNGYVSFPTADEGWRALRAQCKINVLKRGLTLLEFFGGRRGVYQGYAPRADGNDPERYAGQVATLLSRSLGVEVDVTTPVKNLIATEVPRG